MAIKQIGNMVSVTAQGAGDIVLASAETAVSTARSVRLTLGVVEESLGGAIIEATQEKAHAYIKALRSFEDSEQQQIFLQAMAKYRILD